MVKRLLAVVVGCDYEEARRAELDILAGAENDARAVAGLLADRPIRGGELGLMLLLLGEQATSERVREAVRRARSSQRADDTFLFYFSGHGRADDDGLIMVTWDGEYSARELLDALDDDARPAAVILDCCHAGAIRAAGAAVEARVGDAVAEATATWP